jgi:hypothetical protein
METIKMILNGVLLILFIEALLFAPVVFIAATFGDYARTLKYFIPFLLALLPYIIVKKTKTTREARKLNISVLILALAVSVFYLVYFTGLTLTSCAGHPPY